MKTAHYPILAVAGCLLFAAFHFLAGDVADGVKSLNHAMGFVGLHWMIGEQKKPSGEKLDSAMP